jgi:hypothetical protein
VKARNGDTKDKAALVKAIEQVAYEGPRGPMKMGKNRQATQNVYIVKTIKKGAGVAFEIIDTYPNFVDPLLQIASKADGDSAAEEISSIWKDLREPDRASARVRSALKATAEAISATIPTMVSTSVEHE